MEKKETGVKKQQAEGEEENRIGAGEMVYSAPGVPHAMKFLESSVFLAMTTQKRLKGKYDKDTIPYEII